MSSPKPPLIGRFFFENCMCTRLTGIVVTFLVCTVGVFAQSSAGVITSPPNDSTLASSTVVFQWSAGASAMAYWLDIGNVAGGNNYYSSGNLGTVLTVTVNTLPNNGSTIYATLYSLIGGVWTPSAYTYTAFNTATGVGVITSPPNGSALSGTTVTFNWTAGSAATAYWVDVGSTSGGNNYYSSGNLGNVLTTTVNGLPTNGSTIYVTLYSMVGNVWTPNANTYSAMNTSADQGVITSPANGSALTGSSVTLIWTAGSSATAYWVDVGSTSGGNNYYSSGNLGNVLTTTVNGLPTNGTTIYVTLYSMVAQSWIGNTYTYTAFSASPAGGSTPGVMNTPSPKSTLSGSTVTFNWTAGTGVTAYWVDVGSTAGGNNYYSSGNLGNVFTTTVSGLPTNGSTVFVTLYSMISGVWTPNPYTYTAFNVAAAAGVIVSPTNGSTLTGTTVTFDWTAGAGASAYWLDVGSTAGGNNYYSSGNLGNVLSATVSGLPTNGETVYVTLYSMLSNGWTPVASSYNAFNASAGLAAMQTPSPNSTLTGNAATFTWSADSNATAYWVDIGSVAGGNDIFSSGNLGNVFTVSVLSLPANGNTIYVTLYSLVRGQWVSNAYTYVSQAILTYSARTDNCVNGTQTGCNSAATTGQAGATLVYQERVGDPYPPGFTPTTISSGSCPSGWTPTTYPAYCPAPMNSTATDPDFGTYLVMATDENTNKGDAVRPYTAAWIMESDGDWDAFSWDETLLLAKNSGDGEVILNINPAAIHAQTCATAPGCVNMSGIHDAASGGGTSTTLAHGGSWTWSRVAAEPHVLYEMANIPTQVNQVTVASSIATPGTGTLTRVVYADFVNGSGSYGGVMNTAAPGNNTTYTASWTGSFQVADDGSVSYALTGGYDWQGSWTVTIPDTFILPTAGNSSKYGFQATTAGTTGTAEPTWCTTLNCTVTDGGVVWTNIGTLAGQGPGFDLLVYRPPSTSAPGYTRINTRLGKIYRGTGNTAPAGFITTNDQVVCTRAGTYPQTCPLPDRFALHEVGQAINGRYVEISPTGGGGSNAAGSWNSGTLSCQTSNGVWSGAWSPTTAYYYLNVVTYNGYYWNATKANGISGTLSAGTKNQAPPSSGWPTGNTYWSGTEAYCNEYVFDTTSTLVAPDTDWLHGSGHGASGYVNKYWDAFYHSMMYSNPVIDGVLNTDTPMLKTALPCDDHGSYRNAGTTDSTPMFTATTDVPAWYTRYDVPNGACYDEICAFNSGGSGLTYRFGHAYNTGSSYFFATQNNIGVVSPFGDLFAFGTDMMGVRGSSATANAACNNLRGQYQPSASGSVTYLDYVYPITNNTVKNIFRATSCGANTTGATCSEAATLPDWDTACTTTCTDGGVTWTNEGPNNCRGDIVIMDALSSHSAPE